MSDIKLCYKRFMASFLKINSKHECICLRDAYLSRKGYVRSLYKILQDPNLSNEDKKQIQRNLSSLKKTITDIIQKKLDSYRVISNSNYSQQDFTLPAINASKGAWNPFSLFSLQTEQFFTKLGFDFDDNSSEIVSPYYNFSLLNVGENHPSRSHRDTFYIDNSQDLLRTHTTSISAKKLLNSPLPLKSINLGVTYRRDQDSTHTPMFHQVDCMWLDDKVTLKVGLQIMTSYLDYIMGNKRKYRLRPAYFPFTEPSFELDMWHNGKWLEVLGCGMLHKNILQNVQKHNSNCKHSINYRAFAFGMGIDRLLMTKYYISDIKVLYKNDIRFLKQFTR